MVQNSNEATGLDENYLSSPSSPECDIEDMDVVDESSLELDAVSLSSTVTSFEEVCLFNLLLMYGISINLLYLG